MRRPPIEPKGSRHCLFFRPFRNEHTSSRRRGGNTTCVNIKAPDSVGARPSVRGEADSSTLRQHMITSATLRRCSDSFPYATENVMKTLLSYLAKVDIKQLFASSCLLVALALPALGQSPAYDLVGGYTDPSTGNVHVSIPIFKRPGMGASLEINSHIYIGGFPSALQWNGGYTYDIYGNKGNFPQTPSGLEYSAVPEVIWNEGSCTASYDWDVIDPSGASHPLPSTFQDCTGGVAYLPASAVTTDGSGITVTMTVSILSPRSMISRETSTPVQKPL